MMVDQSALDAVVERANKVYELALEASTLLVDLVQMEPIPPFVFTLSRCCDRVTDEADGIHVDLLRLRNASSTIDQTSQKAKTPREPHAGSSVQNPIDEGSNHGISKV